MRRFIAIFLLMLLPLQFSWAAVGVYCGHESGAWAQHLGHHEHAHQHAPAEQDTVDDGVPAVVNDVAADSVSHAGDSPESSDAPKSALPDHACGHCHGTCWSLPAPVEPLVVASLAAHPGATAPGHLRTLAQTPPERPQWARFA